MATEGPVAITGATGAVGGRVARALSQAGAALRLVARDASRAPSGCGEVVTATYSNSEALGRALGGCSTLLLISASEGADRLQQHRNVVDAAAGAGVRHVVYTSFLGAAADATFTFARDHFHTEQHIRSRGLAFTFLRDSVYTDLLAYLPGPDVVIRGPAGTGRLAPVTRDDVAATATAVLVDLDAHAGRTYEVTGPALVDLADIAGELSRLTGRTITYHAETLDEAYASRAQYGAPRWEVDGWVTSFAAIAAGELDVCSDDVRLITGRRPIAPRAWLEAHPESYAHLLPGEHDSLPTS